MNASVPAVTVEAGPHSIAEPAARDAAHAAVHNIMAWAGMLNGATLVDVAEITPSHQQGVGNLYREVDYPLMPCLGIVDFVVPAGAAFDKGDLLATVRWPKLSAAMRGRQSCCDSSCSSPQNPAGSSRVSS